MDNESTQEPEDITNKIQLSWNEVIDMTDDFSKERIIGRGTFGVVYEGVRKNGQMVAVKKFKYMNEVDDKQYKNELGNLSGLCHPNIVKLVGHSYKEDETCREYQGMLVRAIKIYRVICLEYLQNGSLDRYLSEESCGLPWHTCYEIIKGVCEGLNYLHESKIFHLDLKPGNILLDNNMLPKIADFGLSRLFEGTSRSHTTTNFICTRGFAPPEYIDKLKISDKFDVFSLGVIIILIMAGRKGYSKFSDMPSSEYEYFIEVVHGSWKRRLQMTELSRDESCLDAYCNQVKTCIVIALKCVESERHKRPSIGDIIRDLNDPETATIRESHGQRVTERPSTEDLVLCVVRSMLEGVKIKARLNINETDESEVRLPLTAFIISELDKMVHSFRNVANPAAENEVRDLVYDVDDCIEYAVHLDNRKNWWRRLLLRSFMILSGPPIDPVAVELEQIKARVQVVISESGFLHPPSPPNDTIGTTTPGMFVQVNGNIRINSRNYNEISMEHERSHGGVLTSHHHHIIPNSRKAEASSWMDQFRLVGRESQMNEIRNCLEAAPTRFYGCQVMSVWGIAGVGKSVLVRNLYYETMLRNPIFDMYGWVDVSHPFNLSKLCWSLLADFHSVYNDSIRVKDPIQECHKLLQEYRCLVVIDDLQSKEEWDLLKIALAFKNSKSIIIVITAEKSIALHCVDNKEMMFNVKCLEAEASIDLFKMEVRKKSQTSALLNSENTELEQLIMKCGGLPKVIIAVAKFLVAKTDTNMESTRTLNYEFMHVLQSNPEFCGLQSLFGWIHSYFHAGPDLIRLCMFYVSIVPRSQVIRRRRLVMRWVAEGYCRDPEDKTTAEEKGEIDFSMLVDLSMIQPPTCSVFTHMNMVRCQVSAFFHEYIISRPVKENIMVALEVFALNGRCPAPRQPTCRHLVIEESWDRDRIVFESTIDFSRLRSLTVFGKWESFFISGAMKVLRVLDLENATGVTGKDLHQMVKRLPLLKFLSVRGSTGISYLPRSLGDLCLLETLDIRGTSIWALPESVTKLKNLQYLRAGTNSQAKGSSAWHPSTDRLPDPCQSCKQDGVYIPSGIYKLKRLHTLGVLKAQFALPNHGLGSLLLPKPEYGLRQLKEMTQLRKLGVSGIDKNNRKEFCDAISSHVRLESLSVCFDMGSQDCLDKIFVSRDKPLQNLKSLKLYGLEKEVPSWIKHLPQVTKLDLHITISRKTNISHVLGELKELCILRLCVKPRRGNARSLNFCVMMNGKQRCSYLKVKILEIACKSDLKVSFGSEAMQNLEVLTARCSSGLKFDDLKNLSQKKLKEVRYLGSLDNTLKEDMERQLMEHPRKPPLKLEELDGC